MATEREACIALNMVPDMGIAAYRRLVGAFGSAAAALDAGRDRLLDCPGIPRQRLAAIADALQSIDPAGEEARATRMGIRIVALCDADYPAILKRIYDPPLALYCFGDPGAFSVPSAAMVGTRTPSLYGTETARRFAFAIAAAGFCVTSGLARGIDTASHLGALDARGRTIGVLGGAIDCFYPTENRELGREIAKSGGLVVSEFPLGTKPSRITFPRRNRIISGLSRLTLVVEAASKSGSLITAAQALEQNRTVMAIPGRIDVPNSIGCNQLVRDGAMMALAPEDVIDELYSLDLDSAPKAPADEGRARGAASRPRGDPAANAAPASSRRRNPAPRGAPRQPRRPFVPLSDEEQRIVDSIGQEETLIDEVIRHSGIDAGRANALLIALQLKGLAEILPGGWVKRK